MAEIIPIHKHKENFNEVVKNLSNLCKEDLNSINTLILEKLDSSVPLIQEIGKEKIVLLSTHILQEIPKITLKSVVTNNSLYL